MKLKPLFRKCLWIKLIKLSGGKVMVSMEIKQCEKCGRNMVGRGWHKDVKNPNLRVAKDWSCLKGHR